MGISWRFGFRTWVDHANIDGDNVSHYCEGLKAVVVKHNYPRGVQCAYRWGYVDESGNFAFNRYFYEAGDFSCGLAAVKDTEHSQEEYYINKQGERAFTQHFLHCEEFDRRYNIAFVRDINGIGYHIKPDGMKAYERDINITWCSPFSDNLSSKAVCCQATIMQKDGSTKGCYLGLDGTIIGEM